MVYFYKQKRQLTLWQDEEIQFVTNYKNVSTNFVLSMMNITKMIIIMMNNTERNKTISYATAIDFSLHFWLNYFNT